MKISRQFIIGYILMLLLLVVTGCGRQVSPIEEETFTETMKEENGDEMAVEDMMIRSREEAREILREFLKEKYGTEYTVNLPSRNENNDYIATAYVKDSSDAPIRVAVEAATGICRDSKCLKALNSYLEDAIMDSASKVWEKAAIQVNCSFRNEVPNVDRDENDAPETILMEERVNGGIYLMVQKESIDQEEEAALIQQVLKTF